MHSIRISHRILQPIRALGLDRHPGSFNFHGGVTFGAHLDRFRRFGSILRVTFFTALVSSLSSLVGVMVKNRGLEEHVPMTFRTGGGLVQGL